MESCAVGNVAESGKNVFRSWMAENKKEKLLSLSFRIIIKIKSIFQNRNNMFPVKLSGKV